MPCKVQNLQRREACGQEPDPRRSRNACIVDAHESTRKQLGKNPAKRSYIEYYNLVHQFFSMPQIPDAMAAVDKEWAKLEQLPPRQMTKVRNSEVIKKAQKQPSQLFRVGTPIPKKTEDELCSEGTLRKTILAFVQYLQSGEDGSSASQMTAAKVMDAMFRTSSRCSISFLQDTRQPEMHI